MSKNNSNYKKLISVITPIFNEESNIELFLDLLKRSFDKSQYQFQWVVVDDSSTDNSFKVVSDIAKNNKNVLGLQLSKIQGSHCAILAGVNFSKGDLMVIMAADLQDPPKLIPDLIKKWEQGNQIVWAVRYKRHGESAITKILSKSFYF